MLQIDSHQHFWKFDPVRDAWINEEMMAIRRDFLPADLEPVLESCGIDGCVTVQSDQSEQENEFQLSNAAEYPFIKGVVGWVDLQSPDLESRLAYYSQFKKMKGFRHVLQGEPQRDFMLRPAFLRGIGLLKKYNYTYDILVLTDQLSFTRELVSRFPDQPFVLDHMAKPLIKEKKIDDYRKELLELGKYKNLFCKISGLVTEADWHHWKTADFAPYLALATEAFGTQRLLYGSDWPVCRVAATYEQVAGLFKNYFSSFSKSENEMIFGGNAIQFYHLNH
jgi:L-fuconolactonase